MMVFRRKQIVVLSLVLMIIVAGYLQYSYKKASVSPADKDNGRLGEAVYVGNDGEEADANAYSAASDFAENYFIQTRLNREIAREKNEEALAQITQDSNASEDVKARAYEKIMGISSNAEKEARLETILQDEGYEDVVVMIGEENCVDVIVKAPTLTSAQTAQIADAVSRQGNVDMTSIVIKSKY